MPGSPFDDVQFQFLMMTLPLEDLVMGTKEYPVPYEVSCLARVALATGWISPEDIWTILSHFFGLRRSSYARRKRTVQLAELARQVVVIRNPLAAVEFGLQKPLRTRADTLWLYKAANARHFPTLFLNLLRAINTLDAHGDVKRVLDCYMNVCAPNAALAVANAFNAWIGKSPLLERTK